MNSDPAEPTQPEFVLKLLFAEELDAWRVYVDAPRMPEYLRSCFDKYGEAFPVSVDFDDLDRFMRRRRAEYSKRLSREGSVQLEARGQAALELSQWLASAFGSGYRQPEAEDEENAAVRG